MLHLVMNPLKERRIELGLTQKELANRAGVSTGVIIKTEQGLYTDPSFKIINQLKNGLKEIDLIRLYYMWQDLHRYEARNVFFNKSHAPVGLFTYRFIDWRTEVLEIRSRLEFCKLLALHPATVAQYETGRTRSMPQPLIEALLVAEVNPEFVKRLIVKGYSYYDSKHNC